MFPYYCRTSMGFPGDVDVVDTMIWFPSATTAAAKVDYLFADDLALPEGREPVEYTLEQMDRHGIGRAVVDVGLDPVGGRALAAHPDRFIGSCVVDPNQGMDAVRKVER